MPRSLFAMIKKLLIIMLLLSLSSSAIIPAQTNSERFKSVELKFQEYKLKNGLRLILSEDHSAPTLSICITYNVGARNERPGRTGFAHLFEHMMFQGSENVGKGEHFILIDKNGGSMNGSTNQERTNYYQTLPSNQLDLALFLEADRMRSLVINQANLDNQREAVQEERRLRIDNQPYGRTPEVILETAYDNFIYRHSAIGSMEDLNSATIKDVAEFFKIYYSPNNAVLSLVGDFKTEEALEKIRKYFEAIPPQTLPPEPETKEPEQQAERRKVIEDKFAQLPRLDINYKISPSNTPDWYALNILAQILASGLSSRLYLKLVRGEELAQTVSGGAETTRGPALLTFVIQARGEKGIAGIENLLYAEIEKIKNEGVAAWELEKVQMQLRRRRTQTLYSTRTRAILLGQYSVYYNDPALINKLEDIYRQITRDDIQRAARTFLKPSNRTVIITMPASQLSSSIEVKD